MGNAVYIGAKVTREEKERLLMLAQKENVTLAEFIKRRVLTPIEGEGEGAKTAHVAMNIGEMAKYLHVSERKARALCAAGDIRSFKIGKQHRVFKSVLDDYLEKDRARTEVLPAVLRPDEAASFLKVSRATVHRMIESGEIAAIRVANRYRILRDDVLKKMERE